MQKQIPLAPHERFPPQTVQDVCLTRRTMERRLWNDLRAGKSNAQILRELRPIQSEEASAVPYFLEATQSAPWQWGMTIDDTFLAGMAVMPDPVPGRGWFVAYAGEILETPFQIRPMFDRFRDFARLGPFHTLHAWVLDGHRREERFAEWFGFSFDCGPATGFSPTGKDQNLWKWTRSN